jgi:hypothetical protein
MQQTYLAYIVGSKSVSMKRPVIDQDMCVCVCVSIFLNTTALTLESSIFSHFLEQDIQLFCGELCSTHPRTRVHYYSLTYFLEKWALLTLGHLFINLLFFMPFFFLRGGGGSYDP